MKTPKVKKVEFDNRKKILIIHTSARQLSLPYQWLEDKPKKLIAAYPEKEIANEGISYLTDVGKPNTVHVDLFLDYNEDPEFIRQKKIYILTLQLQKAVKETGVSIQQIARQMKTSRMQIHRLLDQTNYNKTFDSLFNLAHVLGSEVTLTLQKRVSVKCLSKIKNLK